MTAVLFFVFVVLMTAVVVGLSTRYLKGRAPVLIAAGLIVWLTYVGLMGYFGVVKNSTMRPPGIAFIFIPVLVFFGICLVRLMSPAGERVALAIPLWVILGTQSFRVVVELFLHELWREGLIPQMLTFSGANMDIYVGASAPLVAWLSTRGKFGLRFAIFWNGVGLLVLANVVVRAVLTTPGPLNLIHAEVPDQMIGTFPYTFLPGFLVPLAVMLHLLALRAIFSKLRIKSGASESNS